MPRSKLTKTSWSSGSDLARPRSGGTAPVDLRGVSLRFVSFRDKQYSLKRAALDLLAGPRLEPERRITALIFIGNLVRWSHP